MRRITYIRPVKDLDVPTYVVEFDTEESEVIEVECGECFPTRVLSESERQEVLDRHYGK